jgi:hypothetical protein
VFALVAPKNIVSNLIAGAVAEAGALQAGDMMQGTYPSSSAVDGVMCV